MRGPLLPALLAAAAVACGGGAAAPDGRDLAPTSQPVALPRAPGGGPRALISDNGSDTVSVVDLVGPRTLGRLTVGFFPDENDGPHHLAVDPAAGALFTAFAYPPSLGGSGPHAGHVGGPRPGVLVRLALADLRLEARAGTDLNPGDVKLTPDGRRVLVTHFDLVRAQQPGALPDRRSNLLVFEADRLTRVASVPVGLAAHGLAVSADSATAFVTCYGSDELAVVALDQPGFPVTTVPVGPGGGDGGSLRYGPYAALLSADGAAVFVSNLESREVRVYSVVDRQFDPARVAPVRGAPFFPALGPDGSSLIVPVQSPDGLVLLDAATLAIRQARALAPSECQRPHEVARAPDGRYFLVCEGDHEGPGALLAFAPATLEPLGRTDLGVYPDGVVFLPGETR